MTEFDPTKYTTDQLFYEFGQQEVKQILAAKGISHDTMVDLGGSDPLDHDDLEMRIIEGARYFADAGIHDFSGTLLTMLLFWDTWRAGNSKKFKTRLMHRISAMFRDEANYKSERYRMKINSTHILRENTGNYSGNLYEAREYWKKFNPSDTDFRKSIRLPTPVPNCEGFRFTEEAAFVLGAIYATGFIGAGGKHKKPCRLIMHGDKKDTGFFEEDLVTLVESTFNVSKTYKPEERPTRNKKSTYDLPSICLNSAAVASWLRYDLGFPQEGTRNLNKTFPKYCTTEHSYLPFLSGFVSAKGTFHNQRSSLRLISRDKGLLAQASELLQKAEIPCSRIYGGQTPFIEISKTNMPILYAKLDIRNSKLLPTAS